MRRSSRWRASYDATLLVDVHLMAERLHFLRHLVSCELFGCEGGPRFELVELLPTVIITICCELAVTARSTVNRRNNSTT